MNRKIARVSITSSLLFEILTQDNEITGLKTTKGIPRDAVFIGSVFNEKTMQASLIFEHDSFSIVADNEEIPVLSIEFSSDLERV